MATNYNASTNIYAPGLRSVGSYQVSGWPYTTGSAVADTARYKVSFPYVTKSITIIASSSAEEADMAGHLRVHFADNIDPGVYTGRHYITLDTDKDSITFDVKCKEIYLSAIGDDVGFELYASLTGIPTGSMYHLTGAGVTETV